MTQYDTTVEDIAAAADALIKQGMTSLSVRDLAVEWAGASAGRSRDVQRIVLNNLLYVRNELLELDDPPTVIPVSYEYFEMPTPEREEDAMRVLPIGRGRMTYGLHVVTDPRNDYIFLAYNRHCAALGTGHLASVMSRFAKEIAAGRLTEEEATARIGIAVRAVTANYPALAGTPALKRLESVG